MKTYLIFAFLLTFIFGIDCLDINPNPLGPIVPPSYTHTSDNGPYATSPTGHRFIPKYGYYHDGMGILRWGPVNDPYTHKLIAAGRPVDKDTMVNPNDPNDRVIVRKYVPQAPVRNFYRRK